MLKIKKQLYTLARIINLLVNKPATYYLLFPISALLIGAVIAITISNGLHYPQYYDDYNLLVTYQNHGIFGGTLYLFNNVNGRLVSHFLSLRVVPSIASNHWLVTGFYLINMALFIISLAFFLNAFFTQHYAVQLPRTQVILAACMLYTIFFFFFFAKRFEFWYFISAIFIYQYSIILILILNALLLKEGITKTARVFILIISLCLGFMSESNALAQLMILCIWLTASIVESREITTQHKWQLTSAILIVLALGMNFLSPGAQHKIMISKTQFATSGAYVDGIHIFINDLIHNWDHVILAGTPPINLSSLWLQIPVALLLVLCIRFFTQYFLLTKSAIANGKTTSIISLAALSILLITYLVPAVLYANILDTLLDRCKFIGCFIIFLWLFNVIVSTSLNFKGRKT